MSAVRSKTGEAVLTQQAATAQRSILCGDWYYTRVDGVVVRWLCDSGPQATNGPQPVADSEIPNEIRDKLR